MCRSLEGGDHAPAIIRMDHHEKILVRYLGVGRQSEHRFASAIPTVGPGDEIEIPCADRGRLHGQAQSFFCILKRLFRLLALSDVYHDAPPCVCRATCFFLRHDLSCHFIDIA